jgi:hypothetical protein
VDCFAAASACVQAAARPALPSGVDAACFQDALLWSRPCLNIDRVASGTLLSMQAKYFLM